MYALPLGPSSQPPLTPSGSSQSTELGSLAVQRLPASCLFHTWCCVYVTASLQVVHCRLPPHVHMSFLYVCISIPALKIGSSALDHFSRLQTYALIYDICFSLSDFASLFMTDSIHLHILQILSTYEVAPMTVVIY